MSDNSLGIHIEISSNCNSRCLDCGRFVKGTDTINPYVDIGSKGNISISAIENIFDKSISETARYVNFTGTYGDFTLHPNALDIMKCISNKIHPHIKNRNKNELTDKIRLLAETNGGARDDEWWHKFGDYILKYFDKGSLVIFALDGTDNDTHQMYRRGVDFDTVLRHAKILIDKGIRTRWSFISFAHNEHQLDEAKQMANEIGFTQFRIRRSRLRHNPKTITNVKQKKKNISDKQISKSQMYTDLVKEKEHSVVNDVPKPWYKKKIDDYVNETSIECEWKKKQQISIDYTGRVWQCCYFSNFYHYNLNLPDYEHVSNNAYDYNYNNQNYERLSVYEDRYNDKWNNINHRTLSNILGHDFFTTDLPDSFNNTTEHKHNPRIVRCSKFCGEKSRTLDKKLTSINKEKEEQ
jgi:hypothetical protein